LLPMLVDRGLSRADRQHHLAMIGGIGSRAAAACARAHGSGPAWEVLEQGRGVILGQALGLRADAALRREHPQLADEVDRLRKVLNSERMPGPGQIGAGADTASGRRWEAAQLWERPKTKSTRCLVSAVRFAITREELIIAPGRCGRRADHRRSPLETPVSTEGNRIDRPTGPERAGEQQFGHKRAVAAHLQNPDQ
jgi:hypothetical protein